MFWEKDAVTKKPVSGDFFLFLELRGCNWHICLSSPAAQAHKMGFIPLPHSKEGHYTDLIPLPLSHAYLSASVTRARRP